FTVTRRPSNADFSAASFWASAGEAEADKTTTMPVRTRRNGTMMAGKCNADRARDRRTIRRPGGHVMNGLTRAVCALAILILGGLAGRSAGAAGDGPSPLFKDSRRILALARARRS